MGQSCVQPFTGFGAETCGSEFGGSWRWVLTVLFQAAGVLSKMQNTYNKKLNLHFFPLKPRVPIQKVSIPTARIWNETLINNLVRAAAETLDA